MGEYEKGVKRRFVSKNYRQDDYAKLYNFKRYNLYVQDYIREFEDLMLKYDIKESEEQTIARVLGVRRGSLLIQDDCNLFGLSMMSESSLSPLNINE